MKTKQIETWSGKFGKEYTDRNSHSFASMENIYQNLYGITRTKLNESFLDNVCKSSKILEVGSNIGNQLLCLQNMGFKNLYGIELQSYSVEISKKRTKQINIIQGNAFDIPFKNGFFDLVFTSGLLIHIHPIDINNVLDEIYRCSNKYIWGFEYYSDKYTNVKYRNHDELLWKADFVKLYLESLDNLVLVKEQHLNYLANDNIDTMYLLKKE